MPKVVFTPELADTIKTIRKENKVASKDVAAAIGRSASYISKLEANEIKSIAVDEFQRILELIIADEDSVDERHEKLLTTYSIKYSKAEKEEQLWFLNIDSVWRRIPIPESLIIEISQLLEEVQLSIEQLVNRINANEELDPELKHGKTPVNEWFMDGDGTAIKISLSIDEVVRILTHEQNTCNYITILAIVHYALKYKRFGDEPVCNDNDLIALGDDCDAFLERHKFYTIARKMQLLANAHSTQEEEQILDEHDIKNRSIVGSIIKCFDFVSDMDIYESNKQFEQFYKNLEWDVGFMLRYISLEWDQIGKCSHSNKVNMLKEIASIVRKYKEMPDKEKRKEVYDFPL